MASAGMSTEAFENFYFDVCTMDYCKMRGRWRRSSAHSAPTRQLKSLHDLTFSIKASRCAVRGLRNIPDASFRVR